MGSESVKWGFWLRFALALSPDGLSRSLLPFLTLDPRTERCSRTDGPPDRGNPTVPSCVLAGF